MPPLAISMLRNDESSAETSVTWAWKLRTAAAIIALALTVALLMRHLAQIGNTPSPTAEAAATEAPESASQIAWRAYMLLPVAPESMNGNSPMPKTSAAPV